MAEGGKGAESPREEYLRLLREVFGFSGLRSGQEEVIEALLAGRSSLAIFPTGGGKSLCYQLPALCWEGLTVVVSPLMALMREQVEVLQSRGVAAERLDSSLDAEGVREVYRKLRAGEITLLYVAPERFANERFRAALGQVTIELLAVDEAHCISEWGHNFRPDYLKLAEAARQFGIKRCLALTATATPAVAADIARAFQIAEEDRVQTGFRRENLALHVTPCAPATRDRLLVEKVGEVAGALIVYVTLQQTAETVAGLLQRAGHSARAYHAGMRAEAREEVQSGFMNDEVRIVVATIAFGMGIDKGNIRGVVHYNLPKTLENYVQEVGRAGRDGEESHCEVLACLDDLTVLENFIYGDTPDPQAIKSVLEHVLLVGRDFDLSLYELSRSCDVKPVVMETLLAYLELQGWIESRGSFFAERAVRFTRGEREALAGHTPERQAYLQRLFAAGRPGRSWLSFSLEETAEKLGEQVEKVRKTFDWLEAHGDIVVKPSKVRKSFRRLRAADATEVRGLAAMMGEVFLQREERDVERLDRVVDFLAEPHCLTVRLLAYFGEEGVGRCGKCSACRGLQKPLPERVNRELGLEELEVIQAVKGERQPALRSPRQLARFFCGLVSPASAGARLKGHRAFALFEAVPFLEVLAAVEVLEGRR
ncbi:RecQ family ATP-dependent DNA helicase [Roseibacillus ishigakijimensis]|uniref:ATP-dependent DNA helicase RecQ n=1 Tax=Roseibacillus ishigakijimensis TaxID=454146 RepID=A0A934VLQ0_9BACT|nr:RecQ family ATP-dependent DNA helicase [Roseibacillus ishigakijimensis]MBK1833120.1 RecQ family ATP-dependent DNA helicase [Roseibacillus ishigakijimensis]